MTDTCNEHQYLEAYLDGELPEAERRRVEQHVAICDACTRELARLRRLSSLFAGYRPTLSADALSRIHDAVGETTWDLGIIRLARRISAVAAAVVLAGSLYLTFFQAEQATAVPVWEQAAVSRPTAADVQTADASGGTGDQAQLAEWIVSDLASGNSRNAQ
jgi:anti-sigma factor RsiW